MAGMEEEPVAVLSDGEIMRRLRRGQLGIEPFVEAHLTPNGYDLTTAEIQVGAEPVVREGPITIEPRAWFAVSTAERVRLPRDLTGELWLRSSHIRKGIITAFGRVDAGFEGNLTVTGFNAGPKAVQLTLGDRYCQIVFAELDAPAEKPYAVRSGTYQGQSGITLDRYSKAAKEGAALGKGTEKPR
jgi:dCTP deaminase